VRGVDAAKEGDLDQRAEPGHDQGSKHDAGPEAAAAGKMFGQRKADIGAEHVEGAVGEIDDPADAENDRQSAGGKKQRRGAGEAGDKLIDEKGHRFFPVFRLAARSGVSAPPF